MSRLPCLAAKMDRCKGVVLGASGAWSDAEMFSSNSKLLKACVFLPATA